MDEVPEDLRNKIRTGFVSENKPTTNNLPKNQLGSRGLRTMSGTVTDIQNTTIYVVKHPKSPNNNTISFLALV